MERIGLLGLIGALALAAAPSVLAAPTGSGEPSVIPSLLSSDRLAQVIVWTVIAGISLLVLVRQRVVTPAGLREHAGRSPGPAPARVWFIAAFGVFVTMTISATIGAGIAQRIGWANSALASVAAALWAGYAPIILALGLIAVLRGSLRTTLTGVGFTARWIDGPLAVGALLLAIPSVYTTLLSAGLIADLVRGVEGDPVTHDLLARLVTDAPSLAWWAVVIGVSVAAPIVEETIYRGLLQTALLSATRSPAVAIVGAATVFAVVHAGTVRPEALPGLFVLGLAFGVAFERTGRLGAPVLMHILFNTINIVLSMT